MRQSLIALALGLAALPQIGAAASPVRDGPAPVLALPTDAPTTVSGVDAACTGIGQTRNDPHWRDYAVRIEVSDHENAYLAGAVITVTDARGRQVVSLSCDSPWLLLDLAPGRYVVHGWIPAANAGPRSAAIVSPARGQIRVVLQFPDL